MIDNVVDSLFPLFLATTCVVSGLSWDRPGWGDRGSFSPAAGAGVSEPHVWSQILEWTDKQTSHTLIALCHCPNQKKDFSPVLQKWLGACEIAVFGSWSKMIQADGHFVENLEFLRVILKISSQKILRWVALTPAPGRDSSLSGGKMRAWTKSVPHSRTQAKS